MATPTFTADPQAPASGTQPQLDKKPGLLTIVVFFAVLGCGLLFTAYSLMHDMNELGTVVTTWTPFLLLGVALLIALGFEFVNGFHDTANAVATVIYTNSLPPHFAVIWSGFFNFLGVLLSSGAVAFGIIALLPVELILQVGSSAGFAMIFALLIAAILWNLGTWWLGLPASSSHTLIGSIIGVGVANALMHGRDGTSGVDWAQATKIGYALLLSPLVGFGFAALLLLALVDSRPVDPDLHRCVFRPRFQRRPERHGPDHADSGGHPAHGVCAEPDDAGGSSPAVRRGGRSHSASPGQKCTAAGTGRPTPGAVRLRAQQGSDAATDPRPRSAGRQHR
jgi:hypothetical protein